MVTIRHTLCICVWTLYICFCMCACVLGVKGEEALVVSSDQQQRWDVFGQSFQPAHVESAHVIIYVQDQEKKYCRNNTQ